VVSECRIELRGRRQLLVRLADDSDSLLLRFLNFYPGHQKTLAVGQRVRVRGEARNGFFGREMVHPTFKAVDDHTPLATALTPVYPTSAQLPQAYLRKAVAAALARAPLAELLPPGTVPPGLPTLREALRPLHQPGPDMPLATLEDRSPPACQRLKFEELLPPLLSPPTPPPDPHTPPAPPAPAVKPDLERFSQTALTTGTAPMRTKTTN